METARSKTASWPNCWTGRLHGAVFELHDRSLGTASVHEALELTAQLVLQIHESQNPVLDLLRGAGYSIRSWPAF